MQSGRIIPVIRQFFSTNIQAKNTQKDGGSNHQGYEQNNHREPTEEEVLTALGLLNAQEELKSSGLSVVSEKLNGKLVLIVKDSAGNSLRTLRASDIHRVLGAGKLGANASQIGRILDRRI